MSQGAEPGGQAGVQPGLTEVAARIAALRASGRARLLVAVAGAPGAGKSTFAAQLADHLNRTGTSAAIVPMDGFHLDNAVLGARGLLSRKGAPETFDSAGFLHLVRRLAAGEEVIAPVFDRARDIAVAGVQVVAPETAVVVVEGNYLLFDEDRWRDLVPLWDLSVCIRVTMAELRRRLVQRWLDHGLLPEAAGARAAGNDIPNAERVLARALPSGITLGSGDC
ncbi:MAG: nucleoside triphosphate hydrolase [Rubellimicrobium sp.]|nr:nucleoside triphosphate hydrolase [Rubellimicrobium sp.]